MLQGWKRVGNAIMIYSKYRTVHIIKISFENRNDRVRSRLESPTCYADRVSYVCHINDKSNAQMGTTFTFFSFKLYLL